MQYGRKRDPYDIWSASVKSFYNREGRWVIVSVDIYNCGTSEEIMYSSLKAAQYQKDVLIRTPPFVTLKMVTVRSG